MVRITALRLTFHGSIVLLLGMLVGFPGFLFGMRHTMDNEIRLFYRQSHLIPVMQGVWMIAIAGSLSHLSLTERFTSWLGWSLVVAAYALVLAQATWGTALAIGWTEAHRKPVMSSALGPLYAGSLIIVAIGSLIGTYIVLRGAYDALRDSTHPIRLLH